MKAIKIVFRSFCFTSWSSLCFNVKSNAKTIVIILMHYVYYYSQLLLPIMTKIIVILLHEEFLQFEWLRAVVFQLILKLRITISKYHSWYLCQISLQIMILPVLLLLLLLLLHTYIHKLYLSSDFSVAYIASISDPNLLILKVTTYIL